MIKVIGAHDPAPSEVILAYTGADTGDYFDKMDRLAVLDRLEAIGKHYALNWAVSLFVLVGVVCMACFIINWVMGYPSDYEAGIVCLVGIPIISATAFRIGLGWVLDSYRDALQVALNE